MRKYFFDKTNIRNILAIVALLFAGLTFAMFFVTGSKGGFITGLSEVSYITFSASLFALAFGKGTIPGETVTDPELLQQLKPGMNYVLIAGFVIAVVVFVLAIVILIGMLYKKFNRKVLLGLSITTVVLLAAVAAILIISKASIYEVAVQHSCSLYPEMTREEVIGVMESIRFEVQHAVGSIFGSVTAILGVISGTAAIIFTRYSISNRQ